MRWLAEIKIPKTILIHECQGVVATGLSLTLCHASQNNRSAQRPADFFPLSGLASWVSLNQINCGQWHCPRLKAALMDDGAFKQPHKQWNQPWLLSRAVSMLQPRLVAGSQLIQVRCASKKAGGSTKNSKGSNAQRLGVKLFHGQACKPGSIIIRQRGTKWKPADNVGLGKDHTIYSLFHGHVQFFKHPQTKRTHVRVQPQQDEPAAFKPSTLPFRVADPLQVRA